MKKQTLSPSQPRILLAEKFFKLVQQQMKKWFITAYVFGSTSRNSARVDSDLDVIFLLKRPPLQKRRWLNSVQGGLWKGKRDGIHISTFKEHYIIYYKNILEPIN